MEYRKLYRKWCKP